MILHFSHIGFTDGRTFMIPFGRCSRRGGSGGRAGHRYHAPGAHVARGHLAVPSATKQNTKRFRHVLTAGAYGIRTRWERGKAAFYEGPPPSHASTAWRENRQSSPILRPGSSPASA